MGAAQTGCIVCGAPLTLHERAVGAFCSSLPCRTEVAVRHRRAASVRLRDAQLSAASSIFTAADGRGADLVAIMPFADGTLVPVDPDRVVRLRESLSAAVAGIAPTPNEVDDHLPRDPEPGSDAAIAAACMTCGGYCCRQGGDHAFLTARDLSNKVASGILAPTDAIVELYLGFLPTFAVRASCNFHGPQGCSIPRPLRSAVCTSFLCEAAAEMVRSVEETRPARVGVASFDGVELQRSRLVEFCSHDAPPGAAAVIDPATGGGVRVPDPGYGLSPGVSPD